jgi:signal transduction histidine kinase
MLAVESALQRLVTLGPVAGAALWTRSATTPPACLLRAGEPLDPALERAIATSTIEGLAIGTFEGLVVTPIQRWLRRHGVLIARSLEGAGDAGVHVAEAAHVLGPLLEREELLHRNNETERTVAAACERRVERLGLDLHDRSIQDLAALVGDVRLLREQVLGVVPPGPQRSILGGRVDDVEARLLAVHTELRELSQSLASPAILSCPLAELLAREAATFRSRTDMELRVESAGDLQSLPVEQRMTVLRVVQEALTNAREHSGAATVRVVVHARRDHVEATVHDDGRGFEVEETLVAAGRRGRLGLVGISERARLLGGTCEIRSRCGGPTTISVFLPRIEPLVYEDEPVPARAAR